MHSFSGANDKVDNRMDATRKKPRADISGRELSGAEHLPAGEITLE
jgi:hypothetical protein